MLDDKGRLCVSDKNNHRILIFNDANNKANGAAADYMLGQPDFTSNTINNGGISERSVNNTYILFYRFSHKDFGKAPDQNYPQAYNITLRTNFYLGT